MAISEEQTQQLSTKVEELLESRDFGSELASNDAYLYEEMVKDAFEQKDIPSDIEAKDLEPEPKLKLKSKLTAEAWSHLLARESIHNEIELREALENEEELVGEMLNHLDGNFDADIEIEEELSEIRNRKPDVKTLSDDLENTYDEATFVEHLKENENEVLLEKVREYATEEGISQDVPVSKIEYITHISLTTDFDTLAEKYLEEAREQRNSSMYASENIFNILEKEKAYEISEIEITSDAEELAQ